MNTTDINYSIEQSIRSFEQRIVSYHQNLNTSGIWLFLATLGCWSVTEEYIRVVAFLISFLLFTHQLISGLNSFKLFTREIKDIKNEINVAGLVENNKKDYLHDLEQVRKKHMPWFRILKYVPAYYFSIIFLIISMIHWLP